MGIEQEVIDAGLHIEFIERDYSKERLDLTIQSFIDKCGYVEADARAAALEVEGMHY